MLLDRSVGVPPATLPEKVSSLIASQGLVAKSYELTLGYDQMSTVEVLSKLLPEASLEDIPHSFETIGGIAHVKLKDTVVEHKHTIGRVIMDKNPSIKTVVNKVDSLDAENCFRILPMEVIAGERDLKTTVVSLELLRSLTSRL